ncbi:protein kinase domain-containing protein [Rhodococcus opacus]|uniref:protein kinase domain-containing protein n=1 Tax=Rhodococcus opacus TaxID=37919 RepID=UPI001C4840B9|nr:protein kinase [Rhodococcus opacus]MBV6759064.1 protein kinase [Rhodococcus opacus]
MGEDDPSCTQPYAVPAVVVELSTGGFDDAREIGRGGFGVVYRCTQTALDRTVAVKVLTVELNDENRARFFREQRAMGKLTGHPNIVNVLHVGTTDSGLPYIVMPFYPQDSLETQIRQHGPLQLGDALRLGVKMAGALETAHRLGILHRDVKPANILLTDYGEPVLTDFGIAHVAGGFETATGTVTGSPAYTAPEVLTGDPPTPASDFYSLGATLFSALTGHAAFERHSGEQVVAQFLRITTQPVPDMREHGIDDDVSAAIARAMSRDVGDRPGSAADFGEQLRQIQLARGLPVAEMALRTDPGGEASAGRAVGQRRSTTHSRRIEGNLPLELTSFVGRRHELTEAKNLLAGSRLLTLTGTGGVGKTRLALRVAEAMQHDYADGVWFVALGELREESLVVDALAETLGLRERSAVPLREVLVEFLIPQKLLLVLDNCEQVVAAVAEVTETMLRACPNLRVLATSREALDIGGETVLRVPALTVPEPDWKPSLRGIPRYDAVRLFTERGAAVVPGFTLTDDTKDAVAQICRRLDGLPLPIELAAARLRAMSPEQILERLTDRFGLLTRGSRSAPSRQQTLRLSIDWSFELCTALEQQVWGWLSVFAGSFDLDAAEQVCGENLTAAELLDVLTSLVDKSILIRGEAGVVVRFRLLETIREYGREKLEQSGEDRHLRRRHRDWCQKLAVGADIAWISAQQLDLISRLRREQPNLRAAFEFCSEEDPDTGLRIAAALLSFWQSQGLYGEGRYWFDRLFSREADPTSIERVKELCSASVLAGLQGDLDACAALVARGRKLADEIRKPVTDAFMTYADGLLTLLRGDPARACRQLESAAPEFGSPELRTLHVGVLYSLGLAYELNGEAARAIGCHEDVLAITEACGESMFRSYSLWAMGIAVWRSGDTDRASRLFDEALRLARQLRSPRSVSSGLEALAWIASARGDATRAAVLLGAADELGRSIGSVAVLYPNLRVYHEQCEQRIRQVLSEKAFEAARLRGRNLGFDDALSYALGEQAPQRSVPAVGSEVKLTKREQEVATLIANGMTNRAIAAKLVISNRTAQGHVEHILTKLGFTSRAQVAAWVVDQTHDERIGPQ